MEAVPLHAVKPTVIAPELLKLFSCVGFPHKIVMDQGTNFASQLMCKLGSLLKVVSLKTSMYHLQTNGLVEQFNETLKRMLRHFVSKYPKH